MADVADEIGAALDDPGPVPAGGAALVRYAGGRAALTRELSGMARAPKRSDFADDPDGYRAAHTRWRSALRKAQRMDDEGKPGKQRRGVSRTRLTDEQRGRVRAVATDRKWRELYRHGARMRIRAVIRVTSPKPGRPADTRERELPAGGPGVYLSPAELDPVMVAYEEGDHNAAAFELLAAFGEAYGFTADDWEVVAVIWLKIWAEGTPEPA